jgi:hypothetical protein
MFLVNFTIAIRIFIQPFKKWIFLYSFYSSKYNYYGFDFVLQLCDPYSKHPEQGNLRPHIRLTNVTCVGHIYCQNVCDVIYERSLVWMNASRLFVLNIIVFVQPFKHLITAIFVIIIRLLLLTQKLKWKLGNGKKILHMQVSML